LAGHLFDRPFSGGTALLRKGKDMAKFITVLWILILAVVIVHGEGTVTVTDVTWQTMNQTTIAWTASTNLYATGSVKDISGEIQRFVLTASVATNIYLRDAQSVDILNGMTAGMTTGAVMNVWAFNTNTNLPVATTGPLTFTVTNTASLSTGSMIIYWR